MTVREEAIAKIGELPEELVQEVKDFIDFLLMKRDRDRWQVSPELAQTRDMAESDFSDYLSNLEEYEERLARGEIQW